MTGVEQADLPPFTNQRARCARCGGAARAACISAVTAPRRAATTSTANAGRAARGGSKSARGREREVPHRQVPDGQRDPPMRADLVAREIGGRRERGSGYFVAAKALVT